MRYFRYSWSEEQIKSEFRRLSLRHHKDKGGNDDTFIEIKQEYDDILAIKRHWDELSRMFTRPVIKKVTQVRYVPVQAKPQAKSITPEEVEKWINVGGVALSALSGVASTVSTLMDSFGSSDDEQAGE